MSFFESAARLTDEAVDEIMTAARTRANELGGRFAVVILDESATTRASYRMGSADPITEGLAAGKAKTSLANRLPTAIWRKLFAEDPYLASTIPTVFDRILEGAVLFGGGYPIEVGGITVGSIGVSGGAEAEDDDVARAGLAAVPEANQFEEHAPSG